MTGTVRERPIIFSGPMVRAIIGGRKTVTRRVVRWPREAKLETKGDFTVLKFPNGGWTDCPYGNAGDRLWVKESFCAHVDYPEALTLPEYEGGHNPDRLLYRADEGRKLVQHYGIPWDRLKWKPSRYMPRWASRLTLEVAMVSVERLHDIVGAEVIREGAVLRGHDDINLGRCPVSAFDERLYPDLMSLWRAGWDKVNGKRAPWASNPWVWRVEFWKVPT